MTSTESVRVTVDRWHVTYYVPHNAHTCREACDRLTSSIKGDVAGACGAMLESMSGASDPSVILIRRLDLDVNLSLDTASVPRSARHWGEEIATAIQETIATADDDSIVRFPDYAAYLARFIADLTNGRAWGKWYYSGFEPLRALTLSRAICEAVVQEPGCTAATLIRLAEGSGLRTILDTLTPADAERIFRVWHNYSGASREAATREWVRLLLACSADLAYRAPHPGDYTFHDALWWAAVTAVARPEAVHDGGMLAAAEALVEVRRALVCLAIPDRNRVLRYLAQGDIERADKLAAFHSAMDRSNALAWFSGQIAGDLNWAQYAEGALFGEQHYVRRFTNPRVIPRGPAIPSPFAGIFRLGPGFCAALDQSLLKSDPAAAALRHLIAMKCLGGARALSSAHDPAVYLFSGAETGWEDFIVEAAVGVAEPADADLTYYDLGASFPMLSAGLNLSLSVLAHRVLQHFQKRLIGLERSSPRHVYDNLLAGTGFVRDSFDAIEVELAAPPLSVLLRLAGFLTEEYVLPWLTKAGETGATEVRAICLRPLAD